MFVPLTSSRESGFFSLFLVCGTCRIWHLINVSGVSIYLFPPFSPFFFFFCVCEISISISEHIKFERIVCSHECIFYISQFPTFMWFELVVLFPKLCVHKLFRFRRPLLTYKTFPKILSIFCSFNRNPFCYWLQIPLYCRYFDIFTQKNKNF